ncbi:Sphingosine-1-phosphate phosphatase 2 [Hypsibius exemplaris]|uniref:Sphingosine-1-phosphate phosphatase 2 n=1 Tax=Hypsibius exemplaris TaxID=2072580 RepID=A0A1W0XB89_HYPEX|nr:Sphingosine-1-phosphate phosphatase 2 [Hypsibius exemplaris]
MDAIKSVFTFLNDAHLVRHFQSLCGLHRAPSPPLSLPDDEEGSSPSPGRVPSTPPSISDLRRHKTFLKGDKGIDSIFSAVDRDSRFISQEELVNRHIQHIQKEEGMIASPSGGRKNGSENHSSPAPRNGRVVPSGSAMDTVRATREEEKMRSEMAPDFVIHSRLLYYLFRFGSSLGYEAFYATFFPIWTWNIDGAVCRRVVFMWVTTMYIGQLMKDILKMPRPSPKIVIQMEPMYVSEYGMPSTHAMIGFSVPFSLLYFCSQRYEFPFVVGLAVCSVWCLLICLSRLYLGMHSVLDIIGGLLLVTGLFALILPLADILDNFQLTSLLAPLIMGAGFLIPSLYYPQTFSEEVSQGQWGPTWADTVTILAAGWGIFMGSWLNYQMGLITAPAITTDGPVLPPPYPIIWPSSQQVIYTIFRTVAGLACLATVRIAGKTMAHLAVCAYYKRDPNEVKGKNLVKFELPVKFFTYAAIGMSATFFIPALFRGLNIARDTMYTEV